MDDLKKYVKDLLEKNVLLSIKTNSESFRKYGKQLRGKLIGSIRGSKTIGNIYNETITALTILSNSLEKSIPAEDIDSITEDRYA